MASAKTRRGVVAGLARRRGATDALGASRGVLRGSLEDGGVHAVVREEPEKSSPQFASEASGRPIAWRDVLGCLESEIARRRAVDAYRAAGFSPDDFGGSRALRATMAEALVRIEDWLELELQSSWVARERRAIRSVRRRLEEELWP